MKILYLLVLVVFSYLIGFALTNIIELSYAWLFSIVYTKLGILLFTMSLIIVVLIAGFLCNILTNIVFHKIPRLMYFACFLVIAYCLYYIYINDVPLNVIFMIIGVLVYFALATNITYKRDYLDK
jgi:hypothetical protein